MRSIFISYRRDDSEGQAGRLYDDLTRRFGKNAVFIDVAGIGTGLDFRKAIDTSVGSCGVLLAVIGPYWLDAKDETGQRRLDNSSDFVRLETAAALKRDIPVVPVLVHGARMPKPEQLPDDLKDLAYRNGLDLRHTSWDSDVEELIKRLPSSPKPMLPRNSVIGGIAVLIILFIAVLMWPSKPRIRTFDVIPADVKKGQSVTFKWDVANADDVKLDPPNAEVSASTNSHIDKPAANTIYTLSASNYWGKVSSFQNVYVNDPNSPKPEEIKVPWSASPSPPNMAGTWQEISPKDPAHPLRLKIVQVGSQISCYITYAQVFADKPFLQANIDQGKATTRMSQSCAPTFQQAGFNYDNNPSFNEFNISLMGSTLVYEQDTHWTSPCDGHRIGVEQNTKKLQKISR